MSTLQRQTLDELKVLYIAWKLGAQLESRYLVGSDEWRDHESAEGAMFDGIETFYIHQAVKLELPVGQLKTRYRIKTNEQASDT